MRRELRSNNLLFYCLFYFLLCSNTSRRASCNSSRGRSRDNGSNERRCSPLKGLFSSLPLRRRRVLLCRWPLRSRFTPTPPSDPSFCWQGESFLLTRERVDLSATHRAWVISKILINSRTSCEEINAKRSYIITLQLLLHPGEAQPADLRFNLRRAPRCDLSSYLRLPLATLVSLYLSPSDLRPIREGDEGNRPRRIADHGDIFGLDISPTPKKAPAGRQWWWDGWCMV
jgi:hypothetical protein